MTFKILQRIVLAGLTLVLGPVGLAADRPNIVMIVSDDQAWSDYAFQGHAHIQTPHIDRLSRESLTFRRGYVPSSLCCPSLVSMITGLYPHQHKITSNDPPLPSPTATRGNARRNPAYQVDREKMVGFMDSVATLPKVLGKEGYLSLQTGKWWQGNFSRGGFTHGMTHGDADQGGRHGDQGLEIGRKTMQPIQEFIHTAHAEKKPFFVWYAPMMPHDPHTPPDRLLAKYKDKTPSLHVAKYWAMVEWFDETVGELLGMLEKEDIARDTLVIYVTDNGWIQNPDAPRYAPRSKQSQYDGGLRTPIMLRWPGRIEPKLSDDLAMSIDLFPTVLSLLSLPVPADRQGINLLDTSALPKRKAIFGECFTHNAVTLDDPSASTRWRWAIQGPWKLIVPDAVNQPDDVVELYDLKNDPNESTNLAAKEPGRVAELKSQLDAWWPGRSGAASP